VVDTAEIQSRGEYVAASGNDCVAECRIDEIFLADKPGEPLLRYLSAGAIGWLRLFCGAAVFPARCRVQLLQEKSLRHPIFHFIGIAVDIGRVETRNLIELVHSSDIAIVDFRFNGVTKRNSKPIRQVGAVEVTLECGRPNLQVAFDGGAIDGSIHRGWYSICP